MPRQIVHLIAAARPNFMKVAPLWHALKRAADFAPVLVHTGQHYDANMSDAFFADLACPSPISISASAPAAMPSRPAAS